MANDAKAVATAVKPISGTAAAPQPISKPLARGDAWLRESRNVEWGGIVRENIRPEDLDGHPTYFSMLGEEARRLDTIWLEAADRSWVAQFIILRSEVGYVLARLIPGTVFRVSSVSVSSPKPIPENWEIVPADPTEGDGYMHRRVSDGRRFGNAGGAPFRDYQEAYEAVVQRPR